MTTKINKQRVNIRENLQLTQKRIESAARTAGRDPHSVRLMAVTKGVEEARIVPALEAGQRLFGENYVQEASGKWPGLKTRYPDIQLHLIGALQTNKAKDAVMLFDAIDTLDRPALAQALAAAMQKTGRRPPLSIEVNLAGEAQKPGCAPAAIPALLQQAENLGLVVRGLMTVPPAGKNPEVYFKELANLARAHGFNHLSMGMSGDFESAIPCGATVIRIGTALFGARH